MNVYPDRKDKLVKTWLKLEKCLEDFETEEELKKGKRPGSSLTYTKSFGTMQRPETAATKNQTFGSRPQTGKVGGFQIKHKVPKGRPQTAVVKSQSYGKRPMSNMLRPDTANYNSNLQQQTREDTLNKVMNSQTLNEIQELYEAKCADNCVEYMGIQAKYFVDKFNKFSTNGKLFLQEQNMSVNCANYIRKLLLNNDYFTHLELAKNNFRDRGCKKLAKALLRNDSIIHVDLSSNDIGEVGATKLFNILRHNNTLISLNLKSYEGLNRNKLGPNGVKVLSEVLAENRTLQFINVAATQIGLTGLNYICEGLEHNQTLFSLDISNNFLGYKLYIPLVKSLNFSGLQELNLSRNQMGDKGIKEQSKAFGHLCHNKIKYLDVSCNKLSNLGLYELAMALTNNLILETLVLDQNQFHGKSISCQATQIGESKSLKKLYMNRCELDEDGGDAIKKGLLKSGRLTHLYLSQNDMYDYGCNAICESLEQNKSLIVLDLSDNRIREQGGIEQAKVLKHNTTLVEMYLRGNTLTDNAGSALMDALICNKTLKILNLHMNPISYRYMNEIQKIIHFHQQKEFKELKPKIMAKIAHLQEFEAQKADVFNKLQMKENDKDEMIDEFKEEEINYDKEEKDQKKQSNDVNMELQDAQKQEHQLADMRRDIEGKIVDLREQTRKEQDRKTREVKMLEDENFKLRMDLDEEKQRMDEDERKLVRGIEKSKLEIQKQHAQKEYVQEQYETNKEQHEKLESELNLEEKGAEEKANEKQPNHGTKLDDSHDPENKTPQDKSVIKNKDAKPTAKAVKNKGKFF